MQFHGNKPLMEPKGKVRQRWLEAGSWCWFVDEFLSVQPDADWSGHTLLSKWQCKSCKHVKNISNTICCKWSSAMEELVFRTRRICTSVCWCGAATLTWWRRSRWGPSWRAPSCPSGSSAPTTTGASSSAPTWTCCSSSPKSSINRASNEGSRRFHNY